MSSSGAGAGAGAESDADPGLEPDREPDREPEPDPGPDRELDPESPPERESDPGADSDDSDAGAEERFGGVKNSGVVGARVTGAEGEADWEAGAGRGTGAGSTGPACGRTAFVLAALVSATDWVARDSAARLIATAAHTWLARFLVRGFIRGVVHGF